MAGPKDHPLPADLQARLTRALLTIGPGKSSDELAGIDERTLLRGAVGWPLKRSTALAIEAALDRHHQRGGGVGG